MMENENEDDMGVSDVENGDISSNSSSSSSDESDYESDASTLMYDESDDDLDMGDSSYHIATNPVTHKINLAKFDAKEWKKITDQENGHRNVPFDQDSSGMSNEL